jgi:hypothetical protein
MTPTEQRPDFGRCSCPECYCAEPPEKGRDQCRLCRRGYHRPGAKKPL